MSDTSLFDMINDISFDKVYIFDEKTESVYAPFVANKAMMQHIDTVMFASELNKMGAVSKQMHYDYLFYSIQKKKRYGKWSKADEEYATTIKNIMIKYVCNEDVAKQYMKLLTEQQIEQLNREKIKGGRKK